MNFGIMFDLRNPTVPETEDEAAAYVRSWARLQNVDVPDDAELKVVRHDRSPTGSGQYPTLHVCYEWEAQE